jgi:hypothetical protein
MDEVCEPDNQVAPVCRMAKFALTIPFGVLLSTVKGTMLRAVSVSRQPITRSIPDLAHYGESGRTCGCTQRTLWARVQHAVHRWGSGGLPPSSVTPSPAFPGQSKP